MKIVIIALVTIAQMIRSLSIYCLALSALPRAYHWLIIFEVDFCHDVMSLCRLIAQLTVDSVKEWHIF
jgi:hypothetical protein